MDKQRQVSKLVREFKCCKCKGEEKYTIRIIINIRNLLGKVKFSQSKQKIAYKMFGRRLSYNNASYLPSKEGKRNENEKEGAFTIFEENVSAVFVICCGIYDVWSGAAGESRSSEAFAL